MASEQFLTVDDQPISLAQALKYLQSSGKLQPFIVEILRQYIIEQELQTRDDLGPALTEQAVIDFRLQRQLTDPSSSRSGLPVMEQITVLQSGHFGFKLENSKLR